MEIDRINNDYSPEKLPDRKPVENENQNVKQNEIEQEEVKNNGYGEKVDIIA